MPARRLTPVAGLMMLVALETALPLRAQDRVVLKNGSEVEGRIVADTGESLVLAIQAGAATGSMTFRYERIAFVNDIDADNITRVRTIANEIEARLQHRRGLELVQPIRKDIVTSARFMERITRDLDRVWPATRIDPACKSAQALGLYPEGFNLKSVIADQTQIERTAYFEAAKRTLVLLIGAPSSENPETAAADRFGGELGKTSEDLAITRELAQAIIRENFALRVLDSEVGASGDRVLAAQALVAGDVLWTVMEDWSVDLDADSSALGDVGRVFATAPARGRAALGRQPSGFRAVWTFPTTAGSRFVQTLRRVGGWKLVDRAYQELPASTEQILHPDRYIRDDAPTTILTLDFQEALGAGAVFQESDTFGEFRIRESLRGNLEEEVLDAACTGWDGDRYSTFEKSSGRLATVWFTTWDTEADATEFAQAYRSVLAAVNTDRFEFREGEPAGGLWNTENDLVAIEAKGKDVAIAIGVPESVFGSVWTTLWQTRKSEPEGPPRVRVPEDIWKRAVDDLEARRAWWNAGGIALTTSGKTSASGYENSALGFAIGNPDGWNVTEGSDDPTVGTVRLNDTTSRAWLGISVCEPPPDLPLNLLVWNLVWGRPSAGESRRTPVNASLGGSPALMVASETTSGGLTRRRDIYAQHGRRLYRITLQAPSGEFDGLEPKLTGLAKSFRFLP